MRRPHYLARDPLWMLPLVALAANVLVVAFLFVEVHDGRSRLRVAVANAATRTPAAETAPVLAVGDKGSLTLAGTPLTTPLDLEFRLAELSTHGSSIVLSTPPSTDAATVARLLEALSQAGFSEVLVEVRD